MVELWIFLCLFELLEVTAWLYRFLSNSEIVRKYKVLSVLVIHRAYSGKY